MNFFIYEKKIRKRIEKKSIYRDIKHETWDQKEIKRLENSGN